MGTTTNLVLGGSGTIGSELCKQLKTIGEEVINLDLKNGFDLRYNDLTLYKDVDYVWFLAWDVGGAKYLNNSDNFYNILNNNTLIAQRTFTFLKEYSIPFMFTSTQLAAPDNLYGLTKLMGEEWTKLLGGQLVKLWNVYGWEDASEKSHVITDFILNALLHGRINLLTNGQEERQFIYIEDCVKNMITIREKKELDVDLTNNEWVKIIEVAEHIANDLQATLHPGKKIGYNHKLPAKHCPLLQFNTPLPLGLKKVISKAQQHLYELNK
jgi:nucleoside-diphosphate-sugar epimerase